MAIVAMALDARGSWMGAIVHPAEPPLRGENGASTNTSESVRNPLRMRIVTAPCVLHVRAKPPGALFDGGPVQGLRDISP
jgi:hypothetical protein